MDKMAEHEWKLLFHSGFVGIHTNIMVPYSSSKSYCHHFGF